MRPGKGAALFVYLEATPYILALLRELKHLCQIPVEVWFLKENSSQDWKLDLPDYCRVAEHDMVGFVRDAHRLLWNARPRLIHLGGWGGDKRLAVLIFIAWVHGVPLFIESDTQMPFEEPWWKGALRRVVYPALFRVPARFLPAGTRQAEYLKTYGVTDERIWIAQMTVDVSAIILFSDAFGSGQRVAWRKRRGIDPEATVFLFVGRLEPQKGIAILIQAFNRLVGTDARARLVMVGDGSMREMVDRQVAECDWLVALGRLDGPDLLEAYCAADVFVLPSRFEPWGLVVNEAMAASLPVVVSNRVGCADDLVADRDTGLEYNFADADSLDNALLKMSQDAAARIRMGRKARRLISDWTLRAEAERITGAWAHLA